MSQTFQNAGRALIVGALFSTLALLNACCGYGLPCPDKSTADPRISLLVENAAPQIVPGGSIQVPMTASFAGGPTAATLAVRGSLPPGVTATFAPATIADGITSIMTLTADSTAGVGRFIFDVVATQTGGTLTNAVQLTGDLKAPFAITVTGGSSVTVGTSQDFVVGVTRAAGFNAPVGMSVLPTSVPAGTAIVFTPASATGNSAQLRLDIPSTASPGQYLMRTIGTYGASRDTVTRLLTILAVPVPPEITVAASPATATIVPGGSATIDIASTRNEGTIGMGNVTLSFAGLPAGASATLTPDNRAAPNSQLVITTTTAIADGSYPITVTATLGTLVRTTTITLVVATPADFALSINPTALTIARNANAQATLGLQRTGPVTAITIDAVSLPAGVTMTTPVTAVTAISAALTFNVNNTAAPGTYPITIRGTAGALTRTTTLTLTIPAPLPSNLTLQLVNPDVTVPSGSTVKIPIKLTRTGTAIGVPLELRVAGIPIGGHAWIAPSLTTGDSATLNVIAGNPGVAKLAVTAVLGAFPPTDVATITVTPSTAPDFAIVPAPQTFTMSTGSFTPMSVEIWRRNGFTGAVSFEAVGDSASQYSFRFSLTQTTGSAVGLEIYAAPGLPAGPHLITIRGRSGAMVREVTMTIITTAQSYPPYPYYPYGIKAPPP